ncbi:MAG: NAD(P)/FAD-dependent oxidoreductase [Pseudomonadota bacterium]
MERFEVDVVVIGAGAVGLACARSLALAGRDVLVVEAAAAIMTETSSRNSEVVHAGLYYPTQSLKARLCVEGRDALYAYCAERGVTHLKCGKLVVATNDDEAERLSALEAQALRNGVDNLERIDGKRARAMEPALSPSVIAALWSPSSGVFDSHAYGLSLRGEIEDFGGALAFGSPIVGGAVGKNGVDLFVGGDTPSKLTARSVVNAAGHRALDVARSFEGGPQFPELVMRWCKGSYFSLSGRAPFKRLVYPMPGAASLGLHYTLDLGGRGRFGPDVEWLADDAGPPFDYRVDTKRAEVFYEAIRRYWSDLPDGALAADYAGVRPKLVKPGAPPGDFVISGPADHGLSGLVHLIGIESPGLTSSLAIGDKVARMLSDTA